MATTNCSVAAEHIQDALAKRRALGQAVIQARIQRGIDEGDVPASTDAAALANFYATVYQGMSMQAKDGASRESLLASVAMAMRSWPAADAVEPPDEKPVRRPKVAGQRAKANGRGDR
jgi:hypothetical protein